MWLTIDIGNSGIKGGLFSPDGLEHVFRLTPLQNGAGKGYLEQIRGHLETHSVERAGVASVVPDLTPVLSTIIEETTGVTAEIVQTSGRAPIGIDYDTPETLGIDRFAAAVAGFAGARTGQNRRQPVIVIDAGTALTYEVVDRTGTYIGGMISPGPSLLRDSLVEKTAQLTSVPLVVPARPIGRSTTEALQSGIMHSCIDGINGAIRRLADAVDEQPVVVMTGGWAEVLAPHLPEVNHVDPHLVLRGIRLLLDYAAEVNR